MKTKTKTNEQKIGTEAGTEPAHPIRIGGEQYYLHYEPRDIILVENVLGIGISQFFKPETKGVRIAGALLWGGLKKKSPNGNLVSAFRASLWEQFDNPYSVLTLSLEGIDVASAAVLAFIQENPAGLHLLFDEIAKGMIASGWVRLKEPAETLDCGALHG